MSKSNLLDVLRSAESTAMRDAASETGHVLLSYLSAQSSADVNGTGKVANYESLHAELSAVAASLVGGHNESSFTAAPAILSMRSALSAELRSDQNGQQDEASHRDALRSKLLLQRGVFEKAVLDACASRGSVTAQQVDNLLHCAWAFLQSATLAAAGPDELSSAAKPLSDMASRPSLAEGEAGAADMGLFPLATYVAPALIMMITALGPSAVLGSSLLELDGGLSTAAQATDLSSFPPADRLKAFTQEVLALIKSLGEVVASSPEGAAAVTARAAHSFQSSLSSCGGVLRAAMDDVGTAQPSHSTGTLCGSHGASSMFEQPVLGMADKHVTGLSPLQMLCMAGLRAPHEGAPGGYRRGTASPPDAGGKSQGGGGREQQLNRDTSAASQALAGIARTGLVSYNPLEHAMHSLGSTIAFLLSEVIAGPPKADTEETGPLESPLHVQPALPPPACTKSLWGWASVLPFLPEPVPTSPLSDGHTGGASTEYSLPLDAVWVAATTAETDDPALAFVSSLFSLSEGASATTAAGAGSNGTLQLSARGIALRAWLQSLAPLSKAAARKRQCPVAETAALATFLRYAVSDNSSGGPPPLWVLVQQALTQLEAGVAAKSVPVPPALTTAWARVTEFRRWMQDRLESYRDEDPVLEAAVNNLRKLAKSRGPMQAMPSGLSAAQARMPGSRASGGAGAGSASPDADVDMDVGIAGGKPSVVAGVPAWIPPSARPNAAYIARHALAAVSENGDIQVGLQALQGPLAASAVQQALAEGAAARTVQNAQPASFQGRRAKQHRVSAASPFDVAGSLSPVLPSSPGTGAVGGVGSGGAGGPAQVGAEAEAPIPAGSEGAALAALCSLAPGSLTYQHFLPTSTSALPGVERVSTLLFTALEGGIEERLLRAALGPSFGGAPPRGTAAPLTVPSQEQLCALSRHAHAVHGSLWPSLLGSPALITGLHARAGAGFMGRWMHESLEASSSPSSDSLLMSSILLYGREGWVACATSSSTEAGRGSHTVHTTSTQLHDQDLDIIRAHHERTARTRAAAMHVIPDLVSQLLPCSPSSASEILWSVSTGLQRGARRVAALLGTTTSSSAGRKDTGDASTKTAALDGVLSAVCLVDNAPTVGCEGCSFASQQALATAAATLTRTCATVASTSLHAVLSKTQKCGLDEDNDGLACLLLPSLSALCEAALHKSGASSHAGSPAQAAGGQGADSATHRVVDLLAALQQLTNAACRSSVAEVAHTEAAVKALCGLNADGTPWTPLHPRALLHALCAGAVDETAVLLHMYAGSVAVGSTSAVNEALSLAAGPPDMFRGVGVNPDDSGVSPAPTTRAFGSTMDVDVVGTTASSHGAMIGEVGQSAACIGLVDVDDIGSDPVAEPGTEGGNEYTTPSPGPTASLCPEGGLGYSVGTPTTLSSLVPVVEVVRPLAQHSSALEPTSSLDTAALAAMAQDRGFTVLVAPSACDAVLGRGMDMDADVSVFAYEEEEEEEEEVAPLHLHSRGNAAEESAHGGSGMRASGTLEQDVQETDAEDEEEMCGPGANPSAMETDEPSSAPAQQGSRGAASPAATTAGARAALLLESVRRALSVPGQGGFGPIALMQAYSAFLRLPAVSTCLHSDLRRAQAACAFSIISAAEDGTGVDSDDVPLAFGGTAARSAFSPAGQAGGRYGALGEATMLAAAGRAIGAPGGAFGFGGVWGPPLLGVHGLYGLGRLHLSLSESGAPGASSASAAVALTAQARLHSGSGAGLAFGPGMGGAAFGGGGAGAGGEGDPSGWNSDDGAEGPTVVADITTDLSALVAAAENGLTASAAVPLVLQLTGSQSLALLPVLDTYGVRLQHAVLEGSGRQPSRALEDCTQRLLQLHYDALRAAAETFLAPAAHRRGSQARSGYSDTQASVAFYRALHAFRHSVVSARPEQALRWCLSPGGPSLPAGYRAAFLWSLLFSKQPRCTPAHKQAVLLILRALLLAATTVEQVRTLGSAAAAAMAHATRAPVKLAGKALDGPEAVAYALLSIVSECYCDSWAGSLDEFLGTNTTSASSSSSPPSSAAAASSIGGKEYSKPSRTSTKAVSREYLTVASSSWGMGSTVELQSKLGAIALYLLRSLQSLSPVSGSLWAAGIGSTLLQQLKEGADAAVAYSASVAVGSTGLLPRSSARDSTGYDKRDQDSRHGGGGGEAFDSKMDVEGSSSKAAEEDEEMDVHGAARAGSGPSQTPEARFSVPVLAPRYAGSMSLASAALLVLGGEPGSAAGVHTLRVGDVVQLAGTVALNIASSNIVGPGCVSSGAQGEGSAHVPPHVDDLTCVLIDVCGSTGRALVLPRADAYMESLQDAATASLTTMSDHVLSSTAVRPPVSVSLLRNGALWVPLSSLMVKQQAVQPSAKGLVPSMELMDLFKILLSLPNLDAGPFVPEVKLPYLAHLTSQGLALAQGQGQGQGQETRKGDNGGATGLSGNAALGAVQSVSMVDAVRDGGKMATGRGTRPDMVITIPSAAALLATPQAPFASPSHAYAQSGAGYSTRAGTVTGGRALTSAPFHGGLVYVTSLSCMLLQLKARATACLAVLTTSPGTGKGQAMLSETGAVQGRNRFLELFVLSGGVSVLSSLTLTPPPAPGFPSLQAMAEQVQATTLMLTDLQRSARQKLRGARRPHATGGGKPYPSGAPTSFVDHATARAAAGGVVRSLSHPPMATSRRRRLQHGVMLPQVSQVAGAGTAGSGGAGALQMAPVALALGNWQLPSRVAGAGGEGHGGKHRAVGRRSISETPGGRARRLGLSSNRPAGPGTTGGTTGTPAATTGGDAERAAAPVTALKFPAGGLFPPPGADPARWALAGQLSDMLGTQYSRYFTYRVLTECGGNADLAADKLIGGGAGQEKKSWTLEQMAAAEAYALQSAGGESILPVPRAGGPSGLPPAAALAAFGQMTDPVPLVLPPGATADYPYDVPDTAPHPLHHHLFHHHTGGGPQAHVSAYGAYSGGAGLLWSDGAAGQGAASGSGGALSVAVPANVRAAVGPAAGALGSSADDAFSISDTEEGDEKEEEEAGGVRTHSPPPGGSPADGRTSPAMGGIESSVALPVVQGLTGGSGTARAPGAGLSAPPGAPPSAGTATASAGMVLLGSGLGASHASHGGGGGPSAAGGGGGAGGDAARFDESILEGISFNEPLIADTLPRLPLGYTPVNKALLLSVVQGSTGATRDRKSGSHHLGYALPAPPLAGPSSLLLPSTGGLSTDYSASQGLPFPYGPPMHFIGQGGADGAAAGPAVDEEESIEPGSAVGGSGAGSADRVALWRGRSAAHYWQAAGSAGTGLRALLELVRATRPLKALPPRRIGQKETRPDAHVALSVALPRVPPTALQRHALVWVEARPSQESVLASLPITRSSGNHEKLAQLSLAALVKTRDMVLRLVGGTGCGRGVWGTVVKHQLFEVPMTEMMPGSRYGLLARATGAQPLPLSGVEPFLASAGPSMSRAEGLALLQGGEYLSPSEGLLRATRGVGAGAGAAAGGAGSTPAAYVATALPPHLNPFVYTLEITVIHVHLPGLVSLQCPSSSASASGHHTQGGLLLEVPSAWLHVPIASYGVSLSDEPAVSLPCDAGMGGPGCGVVLGAGSTGVATLTAQCSAALQACAILTAKSMLTALLTAWPAHLPLTLSMLAPPSPVPPHYLTTVPPGPVPGPAPGPGASRPAATGRPPLPTAAAAAAGHGSAPSDASAEERGAAALMGLLQLTAAEEGVLNTKGSVVTLRSLDRNGQRAGGNASEAGGLPPGSEVGSGASDTPAGSLRGGSGSVGSLADGSGRTGQAAMTGPLQAMLVSLLAAESEGRPFTTGVEVDGAVAGTARVRASSVPDSTDVALASAAAAGGSASRLVWICAACTTFNDPADRACVSSTSGALLCRTCSVPAPAPPAVTINRSPNAATATGSGASPSDAAVSTAHARKQTGGLAAHLVESCLSALAFAANVCAKASARTLTRQSSHPMSSMKTQYESGTVSFPGAACLWITFDEQCHTDPGDDNSFLELYAVDSVRAPALASAPVGPTAEPSRLAAVAELIAHFSGPSHSFKPFLVRADTIHYVVSKGRAMAGRAPRGVLDSGGWGVSLNVSPLPGLLSAHAADVPRAPSLLWAATTLDFLVSGGLSHGQLAVGSLLHSARSLRACWDYLRTPNAPLKHHILGLLHKLLCGAEYLLLTPLHADYEQAGTAAIVQALSSGGPSRVPSAHMQGEQEKAYLQRLTCLPLQDIEILRDLVLSMRDRAERSGGVSSAQGAGLFLPGQLQRLAETVATADAALRRARLQLHLLGATHGQLYSSDPTGIRAASSALLLPIRLDSLNSEGQLIAALCSRTDAPVPILDPMAFPRGSPQHPSPLPAELDTWMPQLIPVKPPLISSMSELEALTCLRELLLCVVTRRRLPDAWALRAVILATRDDPNSLVGIEPSHVAHAQLALATFKPHEDEALLALLASAAARKNKTTALDVSPVTLEVTEADVSTHSALERLRAPTVPTGTSVADVRERERLLAPGNVVMGMPVATFMLRVRVSLILILNNLYKRALPLIDMSSWNEWGGPGAVSALGASLQPLISSHATSGGLAGPVRAPASGGGGGGGVGGGGMQTARSTGSAGGKSAAELLTVASPYQSLQTLTVGALLKRVSHLVLTDSKESQITKAVSVTETPGTSGVKIMLDNRMAMNTINAAVVEARAGRSGPRPGRFLSVTHSMCTFAQLVRHMLEGKVADRSLRCKLNERDALFEVAYVGLEGSAEAGVDWGGLYRDALSRSMTDLFGSGSGLSIFDDGRGLDLFVLTPNAEATRNVDARGPVGLIAGALGAGGPAPAPGALGLGLGSSAEEAEGAATALSMLADGGFMPNPKYSPLNILGSTSSAAAANSAASAGMGGSAAKGGNDGSAGGILPAAALPSAYSQGSAECVPTEGITADTFALASAFYEWCGRLLGISIRTRSGDLDADLSAVAWRLIARETAGLADVTAMDARLGAFLGRILQWQWAGPPAAGAASSDAPASGPEGTDGSGSAGAPSGGPALPTSAAAAFASEFGPLYFVAPDSPLLCFVGRGPGAPASSSTNAAEAHGPAKAGVEVPLGVDLTSAVVRQDFARPLFPGGQAVRVTPANRVRYVRTIVQLALAPYIHACTCIRKGISRIVPDRALSLCGWRDVRRLACGEQTAVDLEALLANCKYDNNGIYHKDHQVIKWFWLAMRSLSQEQLSQFVRFAWGRPNLPRGKWPTGSNGQQVKFTIVPQRNKSQGLPLAHTCFFLIELPEYKTYEDLKRSLITAITWGAGEGFLIV